MYRIALCEDSTQDKLYIQQLLDQVFSELKQHYRLYVWSSAEGFLSEAAPHTFDIAIFDVELDRMNGIEASRRLRAKDKNVIIIFTSSHPEYVFSSFPSEPLNYLVKPVEYTKLLAVIRESVRRIQESQNDVFSFEAKGIVYNIPIKDIVLFESHARIIRIRLSESTYEFYGKLDDIAKNPHLSAFIRCHKSFFVNPVYIQRIGNDAITLSTDDTIPVSRGNMKRVKEEYAMFLNGETR